MQVKQRAKWSKREKNLKIEQGRRIRARIHFITLKSERSSDLLGKWIRGPGDPSSDRFEEGLGSCMKNGEENAEGTDPSLDQLFTPRIFLSPLQLAEQLVLSLHLLFDSCFTQNFGWKLADLLYT